MSWLNFNKKNKKHNVLLADVTKEFGMTQNYIINILSMAGYSVFNIPSFRLNNSHLEIISSAYVNSVKSLYKESSKNFMKFDRIKQMELKRFFNHFINRSFFSTNNINEITDEILLSGNEKIFSENLNPELIRSYFFSIIEEIELREAINTLRLDSNLDLDFDFDFLNFTTNTPVTTITSKPKFIHYELKWRLKAKHAFNDIKSRFFTTIITGHYYIFNSEEDSITVFLTSIKRCFSTVKITLGEVLKQNNSNFNQSWTKIYKPL